MRDAAVPVVLIAGGLVWLLFNLDWIPSFDWVVTLILVGAGAAILALEGITRKSVVGGPLLMAMGLTWLLHFRYAVHWRFLAPGLCIVAGTLMLIARLPALPERRPGRGEPPAPP
jgi:hypothetical protein